MFKEIFSTWEGVSSTTIKFKEDDPKLLDRDVDKTNYQLYFLPNRPFGYTPIIFDTDGSILDKFFGENANRQYLGLGGPVLSRDGKILESLLLINGKFYNNIQTDIDPERTLNDFKSTITHELGHVIGLDHSSINDKVLNVSAPVTILNHIERVISPQELINSLPLMFPIGISELPSLRQDDKSSISLL